MGKRDALLKRNNFNHLMNEEPEKTGTTIVDEISSGLDSEAEQTKIEQVVSSDANTEKPVKKNDIPKKKEERSSQGQKVQVSSKFSFETRKKEPKEIHKNVLIPRTLNDKYVALAKEMGVSENELFNEILKQVFDE